MADIAKTVQDGMANDAAKVAASVAGDTDKAAVNGTSQDVASKPSPKRGAKEGGNESSGKITLKPAKGMRDHGPKQMAVRERVFNIITDIFKRHGAQAIDTPVCELKELLTGKYGEDSKLIYDLADQGGEILSLRYDLTVPFARYLAQNKIHSMKRYQIAKVYRRDQPSFTKGRYREFYQCDFDIAGNSEVMVADVECLRILCEILNALKLSSDYVIKLNHREVLDGLFEVCGVPSDKFRPISSAIDKLDKNPWKEVRKEMVVEKGLPEEIADKLGEYVRMNGGPELVEQLLAGELGQNARAKSGLEGLRILYKYADIMQIKDSIRFDLSLARGLDYYTGVIYEAVLLAKKIEIGSIAAGGRYDTLVKMLSEGGRLDTPCVGVSIGIERILAIMEARLAKNEGVSPTHVYVSSIGDNMIEKRMALVTELWNGGVRAEHTYAGKFRILKEFKYCEDNGIPFIAYFGDEELNAGKVKVRDVKTREELLIDRSELISELKRRIAEAEAASTMDLLSLSS